MILETAVRDGEVMQDFDSESLPTGGSHSLMVKGPPVGSDSESKGCVNLPSPTAVSRMIKKTYKLTLLEVVIAMVLLALVLTILFDCYRQTLKSNVTAKALKQAVQQIEIFDHRLRNLLPHLRPIDQGANLWVQKHPDAVGDALVIHFEQKIDRDLRFCGEMQGMFFLDSQKRLSFVTSGKKGEARLETMLEAVTSIQWTFFDVNQEKWVTEWPKKKAAIPSMIKLILKYSGQDISFAYFLDDPAEPIPF